MEREPLLNATANTQRNHARSPTPSYRAIDSLPPTFKGYDTAPHCIITREIEAAQSEPELWRVPDPAELAYACRVILDRPSSRISHGLHRPHRRLRVDVETAEELEDAETELGVWKYVCAGLTCLIIAISLMIVVGLCFGFLREKGQ